MRLISILILLQSLTSFAKKEHREHEAHVHGGATLEMAFDQLKGQINFKAAAEGLVGFEYEATSQKDKEHVSQVITQFEKNIAGMIKFDPLLKCIISKQKIEIAFEKDEHQEKKQTQKSKKNKESHGQHSNFKAEFNVVCEKTLEKSVITFDFTQFPQLKDIDATLLVGDIQKSIEIKQKPVSVELK